MLCFVSFTLEILISPLDLRHQTQQPALPSQGLGPPGAWSPQAPGAPGRRGLGCFLSLEWRPVCCPWWELFTEVMNKQSVGGIEKSFI